MKNLRWFVAALAVLAAIPASAQISSFKHVIVIVQENRTPDNLFWELCQQATCSTVDRAKYDISTDNWSNYGSPVTPQPVDLAISWDIEHHHDPDWVNMCHQQGTACLMDGAASENCKGSGCPNLGEFTYVQRYNGNTDVLGPYITLALTYGWANLMFQSNQGPSFPAHQFIYGGTSAPSAVDDANGTYAAENIGADNPNGCLAQAPNNTVKLIINGVENGSTTYPCFQHQTLGTILTTHPSPTWRYYTPDQGSLWTAPNAIKSECGISNQGGGTATKCPGREFSGSNPNVFTDPRQVLTDISGCQLRNLNWVIPKGQYSDHAGVDTDKGPEWVASIVNQIGTSQCKDNGSTYWQDTAIVITWDDWGGWYDHEVPPLNPTLGYQLGFRVPMLFVSAYGPNNANGQCAAYINGNDVLDFGSIANFIEGNFLGNSSEGILRFADARALQRGQQGGGTQDLSDFYNLNQQACAFQSIPTTDGAQYFLNDNSLAQPPDDE
jgi:phospholipase C